MALQGRMTAFKIHELSGVDRPAQAGARVAIMKRDTTMAFDPIIKREFSDDKRKELAANGMAQADGSYPIETEEDLHNAVRAIGRSKDEAKTKAHIISRAKSMGLESALPDGWIKKETDMTAAEIRKSLGLAASASDAEVLTAAVAKLAKAEEDKDDAEKRAKAEKEKAEKATRKASMTAAEREHTSGMSDDDADDFMSKTKEDREAAMKKARDGDETYTAKSGATIRKSVVGADVFAIIKAQDEQLTANALAIAKAQEAAELAGFQKAAIEDYSHITGTVEERALMLKGIAEIRKSDPKTADAMTATMKAAEGAAKFAFSTVGTGGGPTGPTGDVNKSLETMATEYQKTHAGLSFAKAYDAVAQSPEGKALYEKARSRRPAYEDND